MGKFFSLNPEKFQPTTEEDEAQLHPDFKSNLPVVLVPKYNHNLLWKLVFEKALISLKFYKT